MSQTTEQDSLKVWAVSVQDLKELNELNCDLAVLKDLKSLEELIHSSSNNTTFRGKLTF